jgi:hypothetical protein
MFVPTICKREVYEKLNGYNETCIMKIMISDTSMHLTSDYIDQILLQKRVKNPWVPTVLEDWIQNPKNTIGLHIKL